MLRAEGSNAGRSTVRAEIDHYVPSADHRAQIVTLVDLSGHD
jgi:hypothetical protein